MSLKGFLFLVKKLVAKSIGFGGGLGTINILKIKILEY